MQAEEFDVGQPVNALGGNLQPPLSLGTRERPFDLVRGSLPAGGSTRRTPDGRSELLVSISGTATFATAAGSRAIAAGDALLVAVGDDYEITVSDEAFEFVVLRWESIAGGESFPLLRGSFRDTVMAWSYEMDLGAVFGVSQAPAMPFGAVFGSVRPHSVSKGHFQQDPELIVMLDGKAEVQVGTECRSVAVGEIVFFPPFSAHSVRNDGDQPADLLAVYWDDERVAAARLDDIDPRGEAPAQTVVFCAPPTPTAGCTSATSRARTSAPTCSRVPSGPSENGQTW